MMSASDGNLGDGVFLPSVSSITFASISFPGLKMTTYFSGTLTWWPVRGFRAFLAARRLTSKTPKFLSSIRRSLTSESTIASNVFWTITLVCCCVSPISSEIVRTMSFLVKTRSLTLDLNPAAIALNCCD